MLTRVSHSVARKQFTHAPDVAALAETSLHAVPELRGALISCEFERGKLTIRGCVESYYAKQRAQTAAAGVVGVVRVQNELDVVRRP